jgi:hypothetical protein
MLNTKVRVRKLLCLLLLYAGGMAFKSAWISAFKVYDGQSSACRYARDDVKGWNGEE